MAQTVWIARHGNREDFADPDWHKTAARPFDPALSPDGIVQARELGQRLAQENIRHIFASPFLRTAQTAHQVATILGLPIKIEAGLCEFLNPAWFRTMPELLPLDVLAAQFPAIDRGYTSRAIAQFPETGMAALERAGRTAMLLTAEFSEDILMVGHGSSVVGATRGLVGGEPEIECRLCCLIKIVQQKNEWHLELRGDTSHLSQSESALRFY
jgi:broad specificity phosphatase PhoE